MGAFLGKNLTLNMGGLLCENLTLNMGGGPFWVKN